MPSGGNNKKDLMGQVFGILTVIGSAESKGASAGWLCKCECGTISEYSSMQLLHKNRNNCGCKTHKHVAIDMTGQRYGRLICLNRTHKVGQRWFWDCKCDCGKTINIDGGSARSGNTNSCGCLQIDRSKEVINKYNATSPISSNAKNFIGDITMQQYAKERNVPYSTLAPMVKNYGIDNVKEYIDSYQNKISNNEIRFAKMIPEATPNLLNLNTLHGIGLKYKPDFHLKDNIYIDIDGLVYHSDLYKEKDKAYHSTKRQRYKDFGLRLIQFRQDELYLKPLIIKSMVDNLLGKSTIVYGRKCEIIKIKSDFFIENHLMGSMKGITCIGLVYEGKIVAGMAYRIANGEVDISRFCNKLGHNVIGGFSKLLNHIKENNYTRRITNWVDLRYGTGDYLLPLGFKLEKTTLGFGWTDGSLVYNRRSCTAMENMTENEVAKVKGWVKIYDAGQAKYTLTL